ncbi:alpha/beta hydrolase family protein [Azohydromonas aeria]|uniref:alpha/beta hydrolase family protein n=1 Tax=Azohydromonas aeria TaxID=2590212 RepID=UPI0012F74055|nr:alpha/beta fold hydrolase [Azohydromonas aeria]
MSTREHAIEIEVDATRIDATVVTPGTAMPGVLFVHGWGGSQEQYLTRAREIAALGCVCLTFDLRGHADTQEQREQVSRESNLRDVLAAYDRLARHPHVDADAIAVVGSSYGGYLAAILTAMRKVRWLALRVPALYIDTGWEVPKVQLHKDQDLKAYRRSFIKPDDNRALRAVADFEGDVLIVQSEHDDTVPHPVITSYREACLQARSLTYRCLAGADHGLTDPTMQRAYSALLTQWLGEMLASARRPGDAAAAQASKAVAGKVAAEQAAPSEAEPEAPPLAR